MSETPEQQQPPSRLQSYLKSAFRIHKESVTTSTWLRATIKWIFDFARNLVIVGAITFLAQKTDSTLLKVIGQIGSVLLMLYVYSYLDTWMILPFHPIKNTTIALILNAIVHICVFVALYIGSQYVIVHSINAIAKGYLGNEVQLKK